MTSTRPYLIRAFYEWILDNQLTPYILIHADKENVSVPRQFVNDGKIVFNISPGVVQGLNIANEYVEFDARFSGVLKHIYAPISAILAIYARENGRGMVFEDETDEGSGDNGGGDEPPTKPDKPKGKKPKLTVVK